jgi:uncharacterized protein YdaU (DUF1376 family)
MSDPYYRMFPREWDDGTSKLTLEQEAALLRICNAINSRRAPLPDDEEGDREMMHRCRVSMRKWRSLKSALVKAGKITIENGVICQARALSEVGYRLEKEDFDAENGAKAARKRAENRAKTSRKSSENNVDDNENNGLALAIPEPEPDIPPISPADPVADAKPKKAPRRRPETSIPDGFPDADAIAEGERIFREYGKDPGQARRAAANFRDDATAKDKRFRDWMAAWRKWCRNSASDWGRLEPVAKAGQSAGRSDESWRVVMRRWKATGSWPAEGDQPGVPGGRCLVPESILEEFGYGEEGGQLRLVAGT